MSRISGLRNDMNKRTFYKERKINNRSFNFLSKQHIIVPLILDINALLYLCITNHQFKFVYSSVLKTNIDLRYYSMTATGKSGNCCLNVLPLFGLPINLLRIDKQIDVR